jgi:hypothetical protein
MSSSVLEQIIDQVRQLPVEQQIEVARAIDQLTWRERWQAVEDRVSQRTKQETITDEEIDEIVREVRREKPLHQRS